MRSIIIKTMDDTSIQITKTAAERINFLCEEDGRDALFLRLRVDGGGCSGFQYVFSLDDERADDDLIITRDNATMAIDAISLPFLKGAELDYVDDFGGAMLKVNNPNATSGCGCGTSFTV